MKFFKLLNLNFKLIIYVTIILIFSLLTLNNINPLLASNVQGINYLSKQLVGIIIGIIGIIFIFQVNLHSEVTKKIIDFIYYTLIVMLVILAFNPPILGDFFVNNQNGANGWFMLFSTRLSFQPVEFFKVLLILKLADISKIHLSGHTKDDFLFIQYIIYGYLPIILVLIEPDLGGALLLLFTTTVMLLFSMKNRKFLKRILIIAGVAFILFLPLLLTNEGQKILVKFTPLHPYQLQRLDSWLNPFSTYGGYQLQQSMIFIGSTGPWGYGAGFSKLQISEPQTDLIFTSFTGFFGWIPALILIGLYFSIIMESLNIADIQKYKDFQLICIGIAALFFIQVIENIGMVIGLLPITGIVLPYMSYGLSAMLTYMSLLGILLNIYNVTSHGIKNNIY